MSDFEIVDRSEMPPRRAAPGKPSELALALERGEVVFIPGPSRTQVGQRYGYLAKQGFKVICRSGTRNGVDGTYVLAEKP